MPRHFVFVPTFNVRDRVIGVLEAIPGEVLHRVEQILIVDNGSSDGTRDALLEWVSRRGDPRFRLFFNSRNYSLGGSTILALREAISRGGDFLTCLHSDGQADPKALDRFLQLATSEVDFIAGNRLADRRLARDYSAVRWWGNVAFRWLQDRVAGQDLGDIGAYLAFNLRTVARLEYWRIPSDMAYQPLLILAAARSTRIRMKSFPITWGKADRSNVEPLRYGLVHLGRLLRLASGRSVLTDRRLEEFESREVTPTPINRASRPAVSAEPSL